LLFKSIENNTTAIEELDNEDVELQNICTRNDIVETALFQ
jgi:hypothetical protein